MGGKLSGLLLLIGALVFLFMHIELCISISDLSQSSTRSIGNEQDITATITHGGHNGIPYVILKGGKGRGGSGGSGSNGAGSGGGSKGGGSGGGSKGGGSKGGGSGGGSKGGGDNGGKKRGGGSGTGDGSSGTGERGGGGGGGSKRSSGEPSASTGISSRSVMDLVMLTTIYIIM